MAVWCTVAACGWLGGGYLLALLLIISGSLTLFLALGRRSPGISREWTVRGCITVWSRLVVGQHLLPGRLRGAVNTRGLREAIPLCRSFTPSARGVRAESPPPPTS
ncbi:hypothetical protein GDO81_020779 [Engystomops pustulosus]|uniref:Uncharacterized protein n=1 Tax=Engystomops pustulosus TaxID=76066 RepID=A0AAV6ZDY0_ENGPU|nr:hypothetical protein GDO81_020779 [Engystomops pustulosus]